MPRGGGDPLAITNLTVWQDAASLAHFVHNTVHAAFLARRAEWFEVLAYFHLVMWWVPAGHRPSLGEALERLAMRRDLGDSDTAFGWGRLPGLMPGPKRGH